MPRLRRVPGGVFCFRESGSTAGRRTWDSAREDATPSGAELRTCGPAVEWDMTRMGIGRASPEGVAQRSERDGRCESSMWLTRPGEVAGGTIVEVRFETRRRRDVLLN